LQFWVRDCDGQTGRLAMAAAAPRCALRAASCCHSSVGVFGRQVAGALHRRVNATQPLGFRQQTTSGIESLQPPVYIKVPVVSEDPKDVLAEMPELLLSGPRPEAVVPDLGAVKQAKAAALSHPLDMPLPAVVSSATASTSSQSVPKPRFAELSNGTRIVCVDRGGMCASLGLFVRQHMSPET